MKKLIFILLFLPLFGFSQSVQIDYREYYRFDTFNVSTVDTTWTIDWDSAFAAYKGPWSGSISIYWTEFTGTMDGTLRLQATADSANTWADWAAFSTQTISDTVGTYIFHIPEGTGAHFDKVRVYFDRNSVTGGKMIPSVRLFKYK